MSEKAATLTGHIKFYNSERGFGFIHVSDEPDYFFHVSNLTNTWTVQPNDLVSFTVGQNKQGICAENVKLMDENS